MATPSAAPLAGGPTGSLRPAVSRSTALLAGGLTGLLSLTGMLRLTAGAFSGQLSRFALVVVLLAMLPWVAYVAHRARHGRMTTRALVVVLGLVVVGFAAVWLAVFGPVLALLCSLGAFAVVWVSDWPQRRPRGDDRFVRIEELQRDEEE
ncbi:hypothetical protein SAMN04488543_2613 [Friedmanniella luteola]|uniref:Uncharacterized protein n=1 Tax=Friedmanniella luteola TaxID=546871 RepID=A0A1H1VZX2_9ACTN|nr:hypothetical protein [Friedmanniella luteola]SDS90407.1 hypothetical protein SAMN04488543_2613 [Friedmanniella luteola]